MHQFDRFFIANVSCGAAAISDLVYKPESSDIVN